MTSPKPTVRRFTNAVQNNIEVPIRAGNRPGLAPMGTIVVLSKGGSSFKNFLVRKLIFRNALIKPFFKIFNSGYQLPELFIGVLFRIPKLDFTGFSAEFDFD